MEYYVRFNSTKEQKKLSSTNILLLSLESPCDFDVVCFHTSRMRFKKATPMYLRSIFSVCATSKH